MSITTIVMTRLRLFALGGLILTAAACGSAEISRLAEDGAAPASPIKVGIKSVGNDHNTVRLFASIDTQAAPEKFEWCAGDLKTCQSAQGQRNALQAAGQTGSLPRIYAAAGQLRVDAGTRLHFFASAAGQEHVLSVRLADRTAPQSTSFPFSEQELLAARPALTGVDFDYDHAKQSIADSTLSLKASVTNSQITALGAGLGVVVGGYALTDSGKPLFVQARAGLDAGNNLTVQASGFAPETVYRLRLYFFQVTGPEQARFVGASKYEYNFVTGRQGSRLANARAEMIAKTFTEFWDWEMGRYDSSKGYARGGGWCVEFIRWNHLPFLKNMSWFSSSEFSRFDADYSGSDIVSMSAKEAIHGDYIRMPGHSFVLLAYDRKLNKVWTIEGNFNRRVLISTRSVSGGWQFGHLTEPMLK